MVGQGLVYRKTKCAEVSKLRVCVDENIPILHSLV